MMNNETVREIYYSPGFFTHQYLIFREHSSVKQTSNIEHAAQRKPYL